MTDKEKQAIETIKKDIERPLKCGDTAICCIDDLKTVLNLVETQEKELEKKDKIIDEMAEWINRIDSTIYCDKSKCDDNCKECVIKEFTNKVERGVKDEHIKYIVLVSIMLSVLLILTGCTNNYGELKGEVINKKYTSKRVIPQAIYTGKTVMSVPITHPAKWEIQIKKEENRRSKNNLD